MPRIALMRQEAGELAALRTIVSALVATHPEPEKLRREISKLSSLTMLALSTEYPGNEMARAISEQMTKAIDIMMIASPNIDAN